MYRKTEATQGQLGFGEKKYGHVVNSTTNPHIQATKIGGRKEACRGISSTHSFQKCGVFTICQTFSKDIFLPVTKLLTLEKCVSCHLEITATQGVRRPAYRLRLISDITRKVIS